MPRTKHALIFCVIVFVGLIAFALYGMFFKRDSVPERPLSAVEFIQNEQSYTVAETPVTDKHQIREGFLAKLKSASYVAAVTEAQDTVSEDEIPADDTNDEPVLEGANLSNGRISSQPERGALFGCSAGTPTTDTDTGPRVTVDGAVIWQPSVSIVASEGARIIRSNALPAHPVGIFPASANDDAYGRYGAQTGLTTENFALQVPQFPALSAAPTCISEGMVGVAINGVPIYAGVEEDRDARTYGAFDACGGHTDGTGVYHYHNESTCLMNSHFEGGQSTILGYARDGFGIFASVEHGTSIENSDLDVCHGHSHSIPWDGELVTMYHYHLTDEFPYSVGCFMGAPAFLGSGG